MGLRELVDKLDVGGKLGFKKSYELSQEDIDRGYVTNHALAQVEEIEDPLEDEKTTELERNPGLEIKKSADIGEASKKGDKISYIIRVKNTGNVTLSKVRVLDELVELDELIDRLLPGEELVFNLDYILKQEDLDKGLVVNRARVEGEDPDGEKIEEEDEIETSLTRKPAMEVEKIGSYVDANGDGLVNVGDRIDYAIVVRNTGNVTLRDILIKDPMLELDIVFAELAVGDYWRYLDSYEFTQEDLDSGRVINRVSVQPSDMDEPEEVEEVTELERNPLLELEKTGSYLDANGDGLVNLGDEIHYTITLVNKGNVTLKNILVEDPLLGMKEVISQLAVGEKLVLKGSYKLSGSDLEEGRVLNRVKAISDEMDKPVEAQHLEEFKADKPRLPSTGAAPLNQALFGGIGLLAGGFLLLRKRRR